MHASVDPSLMTSLVYIHLSGSFRRSVSKASEPIAQGDAGRLVPLPQPLRLASLLVRSGNLVVTRMEACQRSGRTVAKSRRVGMWSATAGLVLVAGRAREGTGRRLAALRPSQLATSPAGVRPH